MSAGHWAAPVATGIGILTDGVIIGNIGSRRRLEGTVIEDGVNTCSRVESANTIPRLYDVLSACTR